MSCRFAREAPPITPSFVIDFSTRWLERVRFRAISPTRSNLARACRLSFSIQDFFSDSRRRENRSRILVWRLCSTVDWFVTGIAEVLTSFRRISLQWNETGGRVRYYSPREIDFSPVFRRSWNLFRFVQGLHRIASRFDHRKFSFLMDISPPPRERFAPIAWEIFSHDSVKKGFLLLHSFLSFFTVSFLFLFFFNARVCFSRLKWNSLGVYFGIVSVVESIFKKKLFVFTFV